MTDSAKKVPCPECHHPDGAPRITNLHGRCPRCHDTGKVNAPVTSKERSPTGAELLAYGIAVGVLPKDCDLLPYEWSAVFRKQISAAWALRSAVETDGWRLIESLEPTVEPPMFVIIAERKPDGSYVVGEARWFGDQGWRWAGNDPTDHWGREVYPTHWRPLPASPGSPEEPEAECAHTLMMPESTLTVIDPFKAKCRVCYEFFDLPLDGPQSSEKASPADLVGALQDRVHKEIGITRPAHAVKASEHVHDWVYAGPNLESCYCSATRHVNGKTEHE